MPVQVVVCGPSRCTEDDRTNAYEVGRLLALAGVVVVCGGGTGVMAAVAAGAAPGTAWSSASAPTTPPTARAPTCQQ